MRLFAALGLIVVAGCSAERNAGLDGPRPEPDRVEVLPVEGAVVAGDTIRFAVDLVWRDGTRARAAAPRFATTGGTIDPAGLYRASGLPGGFIVRAVVSVATGRDLSGEAMVRVSPGPPAVEALRVVPDSVVIPARGEQSFRAEARLSDGSTQPVAVTWRATGGVIDSSGRYTADSVAGTSLVIASATMAGRRLVDSGTVVVAAAVPPPPPPPPPPPEPVVTEVELSPSQAVVAPGASRQFAVVVRRADGSPGPTTGAFGATGGQISATGLFTAGPSVGSFRVWFAHTAGPADTSIVLVQAPAPTLGSVELTPATVVLSVGAPAQFSVVGRMSDGTTMPVQGTYRATGGQVTPTGLYTAGSLAGVYRVWFEHGSGKADTSAIQIQAPPPPPPPPPPSGPLGVNADLTGRRMFPLDNPWNQPVDTASVDPLSDQIVAAIGLTKSLHPDFGASYLGGPFGIPYLVVSGSQVRVPVSFTYADESDPGPYPVPPNAPIEGGASSAGDRHVLVVDRDNWKLYELYAAYPQPDGSWQAGSGAVFDLTSNALRPAGWTSADAAGLPILPGLVRYDEVAAGSIQHALRFTVSRTQRAYVPPARHWASSDPSSLRPPMGMRVRLKASYDISTFPPSAQVILRALKKYGMIVADNGSDWYLSGVADSRWNDSEINTLKRLPGSAFEVVRMTGLVTP